MDYEMSFLRLMIFCSPHVGLANVWDDWKNAIVVKAAKLFTSEFKKISSLQSQREKIIPSWKRKKYQTWSQQSRSEIFRIFVNHAKHLIALTNTQNL